MTQKEENLTKLLHKIAAEQNYDKPEIVLKPIFSGGANYTSKLYTVVIKQENKEDLHLFAKVAELGDALRNELPVFKTEEFFYTKLAKIYSTLEEDNKVPEEHRLYFTKFYGLDPTLYQETVVLENLLALGYGNHDRFNSIDWEYASSAITDLAKMHALSFALSKRYPEQFENALEATKVTMTEAAMEGMMEKVTSLAINAVQPEYKEALQKFTENPKNPFEIYFPIRSTAIVHGDFKGNNLLHRVREDGKVDIKIVDLQTIRAGCPVSDLIYFIITGTDEQFRAQYYDKLIEHYYTQLSAALKRLNLDPEETFSRADFDYELKEKLPYGLTLAFFVLPIVTVDAEDVPELSESLDLTEFPIEKAVNKRYVKRLHGVINDYVKWGILK